MYSFPDITIPDKEKDEKYHMSWAQSICSNAFTPKWTLAFNKMSMLYSFFQE
jgi:hypothetical protein